MNKPYVAPLFLITGFLGAGKTSLLRELIPLLEKRNLRPHVILNDYANADLDSESLKELVDDVKAISGSCVCCGSLDELLMDIEEIQIEERDVILVETNGTTDPLPLIEVLLVARAGERIKALSQIHLVDVKRWQMRDQSNALEIRKTLAAVHVLYTWKDTVDSERYQKVRKEVNTLNPRQQETTVEAIADELQALIETGGKGISDSMVSFYRTSKPDPWSMKDPNFTPSLPKKMPSGHELAHRYIAVQLELPRQLPKKVLVEWLDSLPSAVIRAKGLVELAESPGSFHYFQRVEHELKIQNFPGTPPQDMTLSFLVGIGLDAEHLRQSMEKHLNPDPVENDSGYWS